MTFFPNLAAEMARYSITKREVADAASCSIEEVRAWFKGESEPTFAQAKSTRDKLFPWIEIGYLFESKPIGLDKTT